MHEIKHAPPFNFIRNYRADVLFWIIIPEMVLSSVYCGGRTASKSNNGTIFFYCTFNEIYLVHNVLLCFLLTFMELPVRGNGRGISQILAGDGRSGPEINKPGRPFRLPPKMKYKKIQIKKIENTKTQIPNSRD